MTRPLRTAMMVTLRARRWTICQTAPGEAGVRQAVVGCGRPVVIHLHVCPSLPHSSSPDETEGKPKVLQQEDGPKGRCQGPAGGGSPPGSPSAHTYVPRRG